MKSFAAASVACVYLAVSYMAARDAMRNNVAAAGVVEQGTGAVAICALVAIARTMPPVSDGYGWTLLAAVAALAATSSFARSMMPAAVGIAADEQPYWVGVWDGLVLVLTRACVTAMTVSICASTSMSYGMVIGAAVSATLLLNPLSSFNYSVDVSGKEIRPDKELLLACIRACNIAYEYAGGNVSDACSPSEGIRRAMEINGADPACCFNYSESNVSDRVVFVLSGDALIVAFAGTSIKGDVASDLSVAGDLFETGGETRGMVHSGYWKVFRKVLGDGRLSKVMLGENGLVYRGVFLSDLGVRRVVATGHSMGGAIAMLAAVHIASRATCPVECVTFGSPQVGDLEFATWFDRVVGTSVRVANPYDYVTYTPSSGYRHVRGKYSVFSPFAIGNVFPWAHKLDTYRDAVLLGDQEAYQTFIVASASAAAICAFVYLAWLRPAPA